MTLSQKEVANPYATPTTDLGSVVASDTGDITQKRAEEVRRAHIGHEASVRSIGLLYLLGGILGVLGLVFSIVTLVNRFDSGNGMSFAPMVALATSVGMTGTQLALGVGLRRLRRWAQVGAIILMGLVLLYLAIVMVSIAFTGGAALAGLAISTLMFAIPAYIMWLLVSEKGRMVFSQEYQAIREMTPEIKYQTSLVIKLFAVLLLGLILISVIFAFTGRA